jgi:hypothetical protein
VRLESVFGPDLEVLCQPGETPPPTPPQTPPDAPDDDEPVSDPTDDPQRVLALPPPAVSLARGCGGDAPTEAQGTADDGTEADVAPQPVSDTQVTEAPRKLLEKAMNEHKPTTYTLNAEETAIYDTGDDRAVLSLCVSLEERFGAADSDLRVLHPDAYVAPKRECGVTPNRPRA